MNRPAATRQTRKSKRKAVLQCFLYTPRAKVYNGMQLASKDGDESKRSVEQRKRVRHEPHLVLCRSCAIRQRTQQGGDSRQEPSATGKGRNQDASQRSAKISRTRLTQQRRNEPKNGGAPWRDTGQCTTYLHRQHGHKNLGGRRRRPCDGQGTHNVAQKQDLSTHPAAGNRRSRQPAIKERQNVGSLTRARHKNKHLTAVTQEYDQERHKLERT